MARRWEGGFDVLEQESPEQLEIPFTKSDVGSKKLRFVCVKAAPKDFFQHFSRYVTFDVISCRIFVSESVLQQGRVVTLISGGAVDVS